MLLQGRSVTWVCLEPLVNACMSHHQRIMDRFQIHAKAHHTLLILLVLGEGDLLLLLLLLLSVRGTGIHWGSLTLKWSGLLTFKLVWLLIGIIDWLVTHGLLAKRWRLLSHGWCHRVLLIIRLLLGHLLLVHSIVHHGVHLLLVHGLVHHGIHLLLVHRLVHHGVLLPVASISRSLSISPRDDTLNELNFVEGCRNTVHSKISYDFAELRDLSHNILFTESAINLVVVNLLWPLKNVVEGHRGLILDLFVLWEFDEWLFAGWRHIRGHISRLSRECLSNQVGLSELNFSN